MDIIRRSSPLRFDPIILGTVGRICPARPDGSYVTPERSQRGHAPLSTAPLLIDGRPAANDRTGAHAKACPCVDCGYGRTAYESDITAMLDGLRGQRERLLRTAWHCADSALSDWYGVFRSGWTFYEDGVHAMLADLPTAEVLQSYGYVTRQCEYLARAYEQATMVVFKRMARIAREQVAA